MVMEPRSSETRARCLRRESTSPLGGWEVAAAGCPPCQRQALPGAGRGTRLWPRAPRPAGEPRRAASWAWGERGTDGGQGTVGCTRYGGNSVLAEEPPRMHRCCSVRAYTAGRRSA